jgi:hypothetical protein
MSGLLFKGALIAYKAEYLRRACAGVVVLSGYIVGPNTPTAFSVGFVAQSIKNTVIGVQSIGHQGLGWMRRGASALMALKTSAPVVIDISQKAQDFIDKPRDTTLSVIHDVSLAVEKATRAPQLFLPHAEINGVVTEPILELTEVARTDEPEASWLWLLVPLLVVLYFCYERHMTRRITLVPLPEPINADCAVYTPPVSPRRGRARKSEVEKLRRSPSPVPRLRRR